MTMSLFHRLLLGYLLLVVLVQALFAAQPGIDLAVSRLFADGRAGFPWAGGAVETLNLVVRRLGEAVVLALVLLCLWGGLSGRLKGADLRAWAYPVLCVALASGLIVNMILKTQIGRARPAHLAEFGGTAGFSPPWEMVDECARNCSFTSGEVALAAALAIPLTVLAWAHLASRRARLVALAVAVVYVAVVSLLRIGLGRHYLSDALYSVLIAGGVALALHPLLRIGGVRLGPGGLGALRRGRSGAQG